MKLLGEESDLSSGATVLRLDCVFQLCSSPNLWAEDLVWKWDLCRCSLDPGSPSGFGVSLPSSDWGRLIRVWRYRAKGGALRMKADKWCCHPKKPKNVMGCQQPPEAEVAGRMLPRPSQREYGPASSLASDVWPPGLWAINSCCCDSPSAWPHLWRSEGTQTATDGKVYVLRSRPRSPAEQRLGDPELCHRGARG